MSDNTTGMAIEPVMHEYNTGARRSALKPRYDLIPPESLKRIAARFDMGQSRYGEHNWKLGMPFDDTFNHILDHLFSYRERRKRFLQQAFEDKTSMDAGILHAQMKDSETDGDDLAAAAWGCIALMELERTGRLG